MGRRTRANKPRSPDAAAPCSVADALQEFARPSPFSKPPAAVESCEATPVRILASGRDFADARADKYIGAAAVRFEITGSTEQALRARTAAEDGRNDWTALLSIRIG